MAEITGVDEKVRLIKGSAHSMGAIADKSVHAIITSPPYWGLRNYDDDQSVEWPAMVYRMNEWVEQSAVPAQRCGLGTESALVDYIGHLLLCLREWRRVLRDDGTVWVNLGDSYSSGGRKTRDASLVSATSGLTNRSAGLERSTPTGIKPKDLLMVPALFAIAARADGWYLRSDIIWVKTNPMPESVTDRPTKAHEYVFLLTKSQKYFYDADATKERSTGQSGAAASFKRATKDHVIPNQTVAQHRTDRKEGRDIGTRNLRSVWRIPTQPTSFAHFATFPQKLVEPMLRMSTSDGGCCAVCGRQLERADGKFKKACACDSACVSPSIVLDPFSGSGTTAQVAVQYGRRAIGVDISETYLRDVTAQRFAAGTQLKLVFT